MPEESTPAATDPPRDPPPDGNLQDVLTGITALHKRIFELEKSLVVSGASHTPGLRTLGPELRNVVPAWRRKTPPEPRFHVALAITAAIFLQWPLPGKLALLQPTWLLPAMEGALLIIIVILDSNHRVDRESMLLRVLGLAAAAILSAVNAGSAVRLIVGLVNGTLGHSAESLLVSGAVIWFTNVIVFGVWYWELDRGGPVGRGLGTDQWPDFMFAQMGDPELAPKDWEPNFTDYAYLAFTNATAFSPTDTLPMTRWAKIAMALQAMLSFSVVVLVVARAVNILG
jgi:hypothetical protein